MFNLSQMPAQTRPLECPASRDEEVVAFRPVGPETRDIADEQERAAMARGACAHFPGRPDQPKQEEKEQ